MADSTGRHSGWWLRKKRDYKAAAARPHRTQRGAWRRAAVRTARISDALILHSHSDRADTRLAVVSQHRWRDAPVAAKRLIDEGRVGGIRMLRVQSTAVGWWDLEARQDQWKKDPAKQTAFSSDAAHGNDILRWFLGSEATRVSTHSPVPVMICR